MGLVAAAVLVGLILLILGIAVKALKWLIIIAVVVWLVGAFRAWQARRGAGRY
jgi:Na+-transporting methylmalonyl-CoA/oxaloacetate decarboxylase gamma subunit